jgi:aspartate kinase
MVVMKFGGAVLQHAAGIENMVSIVRNELRKPVVVVVSALGRTTRELANAAGLAATAETEQALRILERIEAFHCALASELLAQGLGAKSTTTRLHDVMHQARSVIRSVGIARQLSDRTLDRVMAYGEDLSRIIAAAALEGAGLDVTEIDARDIVVTTSAYGSAEPLFEKTTVRVRDMQNHVRSSNNGVVVTQGFVGQTEDGSTTTMGKESSNLSATLFAASLGASEVVIWTDVEGVRSIDPRYATTTRVRAHLSYAQARQAAMKGLKLIYPTMISPAEQAGIPIRIASASNPAGESTIIDAQQQEGIPVLFAQPESNHTTVTAMFASLRSWLKAVASLPATIHDLAIQHVDADTTDQAASLVVDNEVVAAVLDHLHTQLCTKNP